MISKCDFWLLITVLLIISSSAQAQQRAKIPRIGFLFIGSKDQPHLEVSSGNADVAAGTEQRHDPDLRKH
jgi:hypothetical protein